MLPEERRQRLVKLAVWYNPASWSMPSLDPRKWFGSAPAASYDPGAVTSFAQNRGFRTLQLAPQAGAMPQAQAPAAVAARQPVASAVARPSQEGPPHVFSDIRAILNKKSNPMATAQAKAGGIVADGVYGPKSRSAGIAAPARPQARRPAPVAAPAAAPAPPAAPAQAPVPQAAPVAVQVPPPAAPAVVHPPASLFGTKADRPPLPAELAKSNHDVDFSNFNGPSWAARERVRRAQ